MAVKWIFLWMGPGLSKVEVIHCLVHGRRTPENRPRCLLQRGQGNFKLAANFGYSSRGSADPRESLRKCWISKLALNAHKVLPAPGVRCFLLLFGRGKPDSAPNVESGFDFLLFL